MDYCRRCDLAFCQEHIKHHVTGPGHELMPRIDADFCCVCSGIYKPPSGYLTERQLIDCRTIRDTLRVDPPRPSAPTAMRALDRLMEDLRTAQHDVEYLGKRAAAAEGAIKGREGT